LCLFWVWESICKQHMRITSTFRMLYGLHSIRGHPRLLLTFLLAQRNIAACVSSQGQSPRHYVYLVNAEFHTSSNQRRSQYNVASLINFSYCECSLLECVQCHRHWHRRSSGSSRHSRKGWLAIRTCGADQRVHRRHYQIRVLSTGSFSSPGRLPSCMCALRIYGKRQDRVLVGDSIGKDRQRCKKFVLLPALVLVG
jgi:hypothetical protein